MVYIRNKNVKGTKYAYLVKSEWDSSKNTSKQKTIKYLGKASDLTLDQIPIEHRENPTVINFVLNNNNLTNISTFHYQFKNKMYDLLINCDIDSLILNYKKYNTSFRLEDFYDFILKPILYDIGYLWKLGKIDIATEHAITNTVNKLIKLITHELSNKTIQSSNSIRVAIMTIDGELHNTACNMLESLLINLGYLVYNLSPSVPLESILNYIEKQNPDILMLSVTLPDHINKINRLIQKINFEKPDLKMLIGGQSSYLLNLNQNQGNNIIIKNTISFQEFTTMMKNINNYKSKNKKIKVSI